MNYDERMAIIRRWFNQTIQPRFSVPPGADPQMVVDDTCEAVNANIESMTTEADMLIILEHVRANIVRTAKSRTVPVVKEFVERTQNAHKSLSESRGATTWTRARVDTDAINARRIRAGEEVSEFCLRGEMKAKLMREQGLTERDFAKYRLTGGQDTVW